MSQATVELSVIATREETQLFSQNGDRTPDIKGKLVAQWLLDKHTKLYCQWMLT